VVLDYRNNAWAFQPLEQLTATGDAPATFANTRTPHPADVGGDLKIASFNVLNYFPTTGEEYVAAGGSCTYYDDRDGNHITDNNCTEGGADGPRGAATDASLKRQQDKIVAAINALGADVVSLEEIENSAKFGEDRDAAVSTLVTALNAAAGSDVWAFAPTPSTSGDQTPEDVIRTAFIYKQAAVQPVGESEILQDPAFDNARDPLGQGFKPVGAGDDQKIAVIVNHFKSKGSGSGDDADQGDGQGASNASRVKQATALVAFADKVKTDVGTDKVFLSGDFNSYTQEDPMQVLYQAGYTDIGSALHPDEHTYLFGGVVGSLDHVLANSAAMATVTGAHVWNINSVESVAMEYSRYNYNATNFYVPDQYRASDHDPLLVGITLGRTPPVKATPHIDVRVLQKHVKVGRTKPHVKVHLSARHLTVTGSVAVYRGKRLVDVAKLKHEKVMFKLAPYRSTGTKTITVRYLGNRDLARASKSITIRVVR
jgi:predicted extracellular nuclease